MLVTILEGENGLTAKQIEEKESLAHNTVSMYVSQINKEAGARIIVYKEGKYFDALRLEKE